VIESGERLRALWVDDSLSVRRVAEQAMLQLGTDITMAIDGVDAIAKLRSASFDILFTDLEMPRMHGYELIRELRYLPQYQQMPIVVVSSRSGHKHQRQARDAGATDFVTKPFNEELLIRTLRRWCGDKARALTPRRA
jgi:CheY-like chemotaxis protein